MSSSWPPVKADCELVVPDPDDITFLEAEKFASRVDYGGYTVPLAFLGRHAAGSAAIAVELALALCKRAMTSPMKPFWKVWPLWRTAAASGSSPSARWWCWMPAAPPQQAIALLRVLNMAKVRHLSAVIGLAEEEGAEAFFSALESGLTAETQKKTVPPCPA